MTELTIALPIGCTSSAVRMFSHSSGPGSSGGGEEFISAIVRLALTTM